MALPRSGADWQRRVSEARRTRVLSPFEALMPGSGYRTRVHEVVYAPELQIAWVETGSGPIRLPPPLYPWAEMMEDLAAQWGAADLYPFEARFSKIRNEYLVDVNPDSCARVRENHSSE